VTIIDFQHPAEDIPKQAFDELGPGFEGGTQYCFNNARLNNIAK
jgi:hypothetical protein